jgi:hypothetical protein
LFLPKFRSSDIPNLIQVFWGSQTLIGYAGSGSGLPPLKNAWISCLNHPDLDLKAKDRADVLYAKNYSPFLDAALLRKYLFR